MWARTRQGKYNAKTTVYGGLVYHSKKEAAYAAELDIRLKAKEIKGWKRQVRIPLEVNGFHIANYYIDFVVTYKDGTIEYVEVKGFETDVWRMKWRLFEALYSHMPNVRLTVVK